jgi:tetratricopeptide (TPR) repeat protein
MRVLALALVLLAGGAAAEPTLIGRVEPIATRYHEDPGALDHLYQDLTRAADSEPRPDIFVALARIAFVWGDVRATSVAQKLEAYDRGRRAARRAIDLDPRSAAGHFWYAANTGRWAQVKGVVRSLALLPEIQRGIDTVLELDPTFPAAYALAGNVYYEVPRLLGGDLVKAEAMFRKGLELDPHFTALRVGLAKTLIRRGRAAEARKELERVLTDRVPTSQADFSVHDVPEARQLLESIRGTS